jgi:putative protein-disulfide isomerase
MCSWCWGFRPTWLQLQQALAPQISLVTLVGGLAPDSDQPMDPGLRRKLEQTWQRITQQIPGTRFNFDFWRLTVPRRSTYPACRAVIAARQMADLEAEMTLAIQQAYYLEARNPSDAEVLTDCAASIGLERAAFAERIASARLKQDFIDELQRVRSIGVDSFPSLVLEHAGARYNIPINYTAVQPMLDDINQLLAIT